MNKFTQNFACLEMPFQSALVQTGTYEFEYFVPTHCFITECLF